MAEKKACPTCGEMYDARGLKGHRRMAHGETTAADGGTQSVTVDRDEVDERTVEAVGRHPGVDVADDAIVIRSMAVQEVVVADEESKENLMGELKQLPTEQLPRGQ